MCVCFCRKAKKYGNPPKIRTAGEKNTEKPENTEDFHPCFDSPGLPAGRPLISASVVPHCGSTFSEFGSTRENMTSQNTSRRSCDVLQFQAHGKDFANVIIIMISILVWPENRGFIVCCRNSGKLQSKSSVRIYMEHAHKHTSTTHTYTHITHIQKQTHACTHTHTHTHNTHTHIHTHAHTRNTHIHTHTHKAASPEFQQILHYMARFQAGHCILYNLWIPTEMREWC